MYKNISEIYEQFGWGAFSDELFDAIRPLIKKWKVKSHFDFACGTGIFASLMLQSGIETGGVDVSREMISVARRHYPGIKFEVSDITKFTTAKPVDLITCNYDSINHLQKFSDWKKLFKNAYLSLSSDGRFLFDFNSLETISKTKFTSVVSTEQHVLIKRCYGKNKKLVFDIEWFIQDKKGRYSRGGEMVEEVSFSLQEVESALKEVGFKKIKVINDIVNKKSISSSKKSEGRFYVLAEK